MKVSLMVLLFCGFSLAHADIKVNTTAVGASLTGSDAIEFTAVLKKLGVQSYNSSTYEFYSIDKGFVTVTNGAACQDGTRTYDITLDVADIDGKVVQQLKIDDSGTCTQADSRAKLLYDLLQKAGGDKLQGECGLGHCWSTITGIDCSHNSNSKADPKYVDTCDISQNSAGLVKGTN